MIHNEALLGAVIERPDDDGPRLVYADWLEEHDEPARAEFIRVQCSLARLPAKDPRQPALQHREQELLGQYGWVWAEAFAPVVSEWAYRRGFIERIGMRLETSPDAILAVLRKAPIRHLRDTSQFCDLSGIVDALPHLGCLTGLELWYLYAFDNALLGTILASPHLANLRTLILHHDRNGNMAEERVLVEAMHSPHRANLEELAVNVDGTWRGPSRKLLNAIATSPYLGKLRKLDLTNAGDEGNRPQMDLKTARALGKSPNLAGLEELDLGRTSFSLKTWDEVLKWPWLSQLKWLRLHYARQVNPPSFLTVAEIRNLPAYRAAFEQRVPVVDWDTFWGGGTYWRGLSWEGLQQQHLFSMWAYIRRQDYTGLEAAFRADCCKYASEAAAAAIDDLPFKRYQKDLAAGLKQAIAASASTPGATSIYLRIRPDLRWDAEYHVSGEAVREPFEPYESYSYVGPLANFAAPSFPEAAKVRDRFSEWKPLDPGGVRHYLLARTVAAFGRCVARNKAPVPVIFDCMYAVFRLYSPGNETPH
jgi:uncharacterized protein (TIGR02996 family)